RLNSNRESLAGICATKPSVVTNGALYQMPLGEPSAPILAALRAAYATNNPEHPGCNSPAAGKTGQPTP
ncbi:hypothetical protein, partial [Acetobacter sp.]|uniref:hypothetical protein n=1 Tax=Acetobacter sp. TaxID=440 RepID=UPI0039E900A3